MTISGAAAAPNMGFHSSRLVAIVMTFFNVRLGWWMRNPAPLFVSLAESGLAEAVDAATPPAGISSWTREAGGTATRPTGRNMINELCQTEPANCHCGR